MVTRQRQPHFNGRKTEEKGRVSEVHAPFFCLNMLNDKRGEAPSKHCSPIMLAIAEAPMLVWLHPERPRDGVYSETEL